MFHRLLLIAAAAISGLLGENVQEPFFFIQASDPQFGMYSGNRDFARETANFELLIGIANRLRPAFLVVTGDLVNRPGDAAQIREYLRIAAKLDPAIPLYNLPGNHDLGEVPTPERLAAYRQTFGRDYYSFRAGSLTGLVLDTPLIAHPENVPGEAAKQEAWFRQELTRAKREGDRRVVVFQHHPWFLLIPDEPDKYFNMPGEARQRYLAMLREAGVALVFAGHFHQNVTARTGALELVTTGPVGMPLGLGRSGFRVVIVRRDRIDHQYYPLEEAPSRIDLSAP